MFRDFIIFYHSKISRSLEQKNNKIYSTLGRVVERLSVDKCIGTWLSNDMFDKYKILTKFCDTYDSTLSLSLSPLSLSLPLSLKNGLSWLRDHSLICTTVRFEINVTINSIRYQVIPPINNLYYPLLQLPNLYTVLQEHMTR